jgi:hypothetical protein
MRKRFLTLSVLAVCLLVLLSFRRGQRRDNLTYDGKSIGYWEKQALVELPQGNEKAIVPAIKKMGPEAVPFWLERMQTKDSGFRRAYAKFWSTLPNRTKTRLPAPIDQRTRRNVAYWILSELQFTNGIPELIQMSYSQDPELQFYAINLLWLRAYHFYRPSSECVAAFCSAVQTGDARTRLSAIDGLNVLPVQPEALGTLRSALNDPEEEVRVKAATVILRLQPDADFTHIFQSGNASSNHNVRAISNWELSRPKTPLPPQL